ncbi:MAG: hypothetical protein IT160_00965 [Bryobacterales bacterium]|nr:hypothetical protein [Bryobacterales bacterium]
MNWNRSETLGLANPRCTQCRGTGLLLARHAMAPCLCVLRAIFRRCVSRFRLSVARGASYTRTSLEYTGGRDYRFSWGRKDEEYAADFLLVSKRALNTNEYRIFSAYHLLGAEWRLCCRRLQIQRGVFFHEVYRIEAKLGRVFRELQPYGLYPIEEYFHGSTREMDRRIRPCEPLAPGRRLKPHQVIPIPAPKAA